MDTKMAAKLYQKGLEAQNEKRLAQALRFYKAAIQSDVQYRPALMCLGLVYSQMGQAKLALGFFQQAYEVQADPSVCFNLGSECFKLEQYESSRDYLKECLRLDKRMLKAHLLLAYLYQTNQKFDKAAVYFQNALKISPMNRMAILGYAASLGEQGHYENALYATERYLRNVKSDPFAEELRYSLLLELGRIDQAYEGYAKLSQSSPKFTKFSEHLQRLHNEARKEHKELFPGLDSKIGERVERLKASLSKRKSHEDSGLSAQKNGIEGSQDLADELREDMQSMVDLSLLHLFKGDAAKAMKYLFQARKWKGRDQ